jgi:hypothetical protein
MDWFRKSFRRTPLDKAAKQERQNQWITERFKDWQRAWHDAFDTDATLQAAGEFERPDPLPDDVQDDYRLVFGLSHAEQKTRQHCFAMFPNGAEMHRRFDQFLAAQPTRMSEQDARWLAAQLLQVLLTIRPDQSETWKHIAVVESKPMDDRHPLANYDPIHTVFESNLLEPYSEQDLPAIAAAHFLAEPLYASGGNFFELREWVTSAMRSKSRDEISTIVYRLWRGGWFAGQADDGLVLAERPQ